MKAIVISEESHGFIGVADTPEHAINFLISEDWLNDGTTFPTFNNKIHRWEDISIIDKFGENWADTLRSKNCDELNEALDECFYFDEVDIYTGED